MHFDLEIVAAVLVPLATGWLLATRLPLDEAARAAIRLWFIPLTLVWFAPCWLTGGSPVPFDTLVARTDPWKALASPGFIPSNPLLNDIPLQVVPWREVVTDAFRRGELPLFNRFAASGSGLWENPMPAILYPLTILGLPFSSFAWPLFAAVAKMLLATSGMYYFLRSDDRSDLASRFGAVAYGMASYQYAYMLYQHTNVTALIPWLLVAIRGFRTVTAALIVVAMLFAGHPESVLLAAYVAVPFAVMAIANEPREHRRRAFLRLATAAVAAALIAAPVVLPFLDFLPMSERVSWLEHQPDLIRSRTLSVRNLVPFVLPGHLDHTRLTMEAEHFNETASQYAGLATFALFVLAASAAPRRNRFWLLLFALFALLIFELQPVRSVVSQIPLLRYVFHDRLRFAIGLIMAILAARALDERIERRRRLIAISAAAGAVVALAVAVGWPLYRQFGTEWRVAGSAVAGVAGLVGLNIPRLRAWLPLFVFVDLASLGMIYHAPVGRELFYPRTPLIEALGSDARPPWRIVGLDDALVPNTATMAGLEDIRVHDAMSFAPYGRLLEAAGLDRRFYIGTFHEVPPRLLLDFLGVRAIVASPRARAPWPESYRGPDGVVFRNDTALPRFFVPERTTNAPFGSQGNARVVHIAEGTRIRLSPAAVTLARYDAASAEVLVKASGETFVASSEVALPGWRLERNGTPWPLTTINACFLGWSVPAGEHRFVLRYCPKRLSMALWIGAAGIVFLAAAARSLREAR